MPPPVSVSATQTIVRKVQGGSDPVDHRFVILSETPVPAAGFAFSPGPQMTRQDVYAALMAQGMSERNATRLLHDAVASFTP